MIGVVTIASFSVVIPLLAGVVSFRRLPAAGRWLILLLFVWLIVETIAYSLRMEGQNNWLVYMMLSFFEILILTVFYQSIFQDERAKNLCTALAWVGLFIIVAEYSIVQSPENVISVLYECAYFFGMGLYVANEIKYNRIPMRFKWINWSVMFYFLGTALYVASWKYLMKDGATFMLAVKAHAYFLLVCYSLFTYTIWKLRIEREQLNFSTDKSHLNN
jgi:hypothetical protein